MAAFLNLVYLVTGMGDPNPVTSSPGRSFTKWVFKDEDMDDNQNTEEKEEEEVKKEAVQPSESAPTLDGILRREDARSVSVDKVTPIGLSCAGEGDDDPTATTKRSKNQKKKDKKKSHRNRSNSTLSSDSGGNNKAVSWGVVEEVLLSRDQGLGSVPSSGLFPLGFGLEEDRVEIPIDLHVSASQVKLIERAQKLGISMEPTRSDSEYHMLETRQFDYRHGKNPLFHSSTEDERVALLGDTARPRSRSRSSSLGSDETIHTVNESNRELIDIRNSRQSSSGCSCKAVKVDKLSVTKLKQELIHHQDKLDMTLDQINALSKADLITTVRDVLQSCPLCISNSCSCVKEGIGCHVEVCSCFKRNNLQVCENKFNEEGYSSSAVDEYRKKYITSTSSSKRTLSA